MGYNLVYCLKSKEHPLAHAASFEILLALFTLLLADKSRAGTWTALATAPATGVNETLVLSDGSILTDDGSGNCNKLTPDIHGSYINGTWTRLAPMKNGRLFFATELLTNGTVFVAGGEYGEGDDHGEIYDPLRNTWTEIYPDPVPAVNFSDCPSETLPNGNVLLAPVSKFGGILIYNVASNNWQTAASTGNLNEDCWVKLANDNVLAIETASETAEHYVPSANEWITDPTLPVPLYGYGAELGPGFLLPNGNAFCIGATTNTAIYTPGNTATSAGSWVAGPSMQIQVGTNLVGLGGVDAPGAMMANGNILCALGPVATNGISASGFNSPTYYFEYNYSANTFTQENAPGGGSTYNAPTYVQSMLALPDGNILLVSGQNSTSLYVYTPSGTPLAAGQPTISSINEEPDGTYQLLGLGLNGISQGAAYGDDEQMNSNYPLVRMTNSATGNVYYARTYNWSSTSLQTGSRIITTDFTLPQNLPSGIYSVVAVANGIASAPKTFTYLPPSVPSGLSAASGSNSFVTLSWNASSGATAYEVKRSPGSTGYFAPLARVTGLSYTNTGLTNGLAYYYKVDAISSTGGPSSDSSAVVATPGGPTPIPGATQVNLSGYYNRAGLYTDGQSFSGGLDGDGSAYSATLLGTSLWWNNLAFSLGPSNALDCISCANQTVTLPAGRFNTLQILGIGVNGSQAAQTFTVTYTDNSTATFTQSFSDWASAQYFQGEFPVTSMLYRDTSTGSTEFLHMSLNGYVLALDQTKTVESVTLPNDSNVVLLSMMLANDPVNASLSAYYNRAGLYTDGTTFTNPATGGADGSGNAFSATLLGTSQTWSNSIFAFGPRDVTNVISCAGQTITLPPGNYSQLQILGSGVLGNQTAQEFTVAYSDNSTMTFTQSMSDWFTPQNYSGESGAVIMSYRNTSKGNKNTGTFYVYGYSFPLNSSKTVESVLLPSDTNVIVAAVSLVPDWQPTFAVNPMILPGIDAGQNYSGTIATNASDLNTGDTLTFAQVSGPSWLAVAGNGTLSGVPANTNAGPNTFLVSVTDSGGLSSTDTLYITVTGAPSFILNPFTMPGIMAGQNYSGTIATNATDPNPGDSMTFALVSGPSWLSVAGNGALSGIPLSANVGTNSFMVSVTDQGGLTNTATLYLPVTPAPPILSTITFQAGSIMLNWSGGIGPYQIEMTTNLLNPNWQPVGSTSTNSITVTPSNSAAFYQIIGQ